MIVLCNNLINILNIHGSINVYNKSVIEPNQMIDYGKLLLKRS